jgi:hypothetical protein
VADGVADLGIPGLTDPVRIGVGGFAVVYRAFQPSVKRPVAVKIITSEVDDRAKRRFERECEALGALSEHPGIVTVHDAGFTPDGQPYLVMAHLGGGSLSEKLHRDGALPWDTAIALAGQVANALAAAHRAGVIHCDIKPANVLTTSDGTPQLADFGIARLAGDQVTKTTSVTASLPYAAPEILTGTPPSIQSDVYALGATLHELMSGRPAFGSQGDEALAARLRRIMEDPPPDLRPHDVPEEVASLVEAMLAKDPADRPDSAADVARALQDHARAHGIRASRMQGPPSGEVGEPVPAATQPLPGGTAVMDGAPAAAPLPTADPGAPGTEAWPADYATVAVPGSGYQPTHRVPWTGMYAWAAPDIRMPIAATMDPDLDVAVVGWYGDWAQILCSNGWQAWVDGRLLVPLY